jgi:serine/threonine protein kinase
VIGKTISQYRIEEKLGQGGMGEVYRASDSKLRRDVALKVLPDVFAADPERMARFRREAQVLASLNHPHIGAIYGLEEIEGIHALVLELVEGPTLADKIRKGRLSIEEALPIAAQIARALEVAHEQGIIHRDLKPENIKFTTDGQVKVLDFGLAKALEGEQPLAPNGQSPTLSPTVSPAITGGMTAANVILGTAGYMSPEQARGQPVDRRADIWAYGVCLFEMLSGQRLFMGDTVSDTLASVLKVDPDWSLLPVRTPARVKRLLRRCLERDPMRRLRDMGDARLSLEEALAGGLEDEGEAPLRFANSFSRSRTCRRGLGAARRWRSLRTARASRTRAKAVCGSGTWTASIPGPWPARTGRSNPSGPRTASGWLTDRPESSGRSGRPAVNRRRSASFPAASMRRRAVSGGRKEISSSATEMVPS